LWLTYSKLTLDLHGYTDANENMAEDQCSISGYAFLVNSSTVS